MADVQINTAQIRSMFSARAITINGTIHPTDQGYFVLAYTYNRILYNIRSLNAATNLNCKVRGTLNNVSLPVDDDRYNLIPGSIAGVPGYWGIVNGPLSVFWVQNNNVAGGDIFVDLTVFTEGVDR